MNLFLNGSSAQSNQQSLGIYTISSQKIANNKHPVYIKNTDFQDFYLYFREKGNFSIIRNKKLVLLFANC